MSDFSSIVIKITSFLIIALGILIEVLLFLIDFFGLTRVVLKLTGATFLVNVISTLGLGHVELHTLITELLGRADHRVLRWTTDLE